MSFFETLNVLDALIIVIIGWNLIRGLNKGFIEEALSILGLVISALITFKAINIISYHFQIPPAVKVGIGVAIFLLLISLSKYISIVAEKKVAETPLGVVSRMLGFLFGIVRGVVISAIVVFSIATFFPKSYLIQKSSLGGITVPVIDKIIQIANGKFESKWRENWSTAKHFLTKNYQKFKGEILPLNRKT